MIILEIYLIFNLKLYLHVGKYFVIGIQHIGNVNITARLMAEI